MKKSILLTVLLTLFIMAMGLSSFAQYTKIHDLDGTNGKRPKGDLLYDGTYLYGMAEEGGASGFHGSVFKIKPDGTGFTNLLNFDNAGNGRKAIGSLITDGTYLYGMTERGGANNLGTIFKIKPDGTGYTKLLDFDGANNGNYPLGSLVSDGTALYGTTSYGGTNSYGVIFKIMPDGTGFTKLLDFDYVPNGTFPGGTLLRIGTELYGTAGSGGTGSGTVFKINTDGTGFVKVHQFAGTTGNGGAPTGTLVSDGVYLYGMIGIGGGTGSIYRVKTDGTGYSQIFDFANTTNGIRASLITDSTYLYGMTATDTTGSYGTIFKVKTDGTGYVKMKQFKGSTVGGDGRAPSGSLIAIGTTLYGMTSSGGVGDNGIVFKYDLVPNTAGIGGHDANNNFSVYPNPTNGKLSIKTKDAGTYRLSIYNTTGTRVYFEPAIRFSKEVDMAAYPKGIYFIKLMGETVSYNSTVIVQ